MILKQNWYYSCGFDNVINCEFYVFDINTIAAMEICEFLQQAGI